MIYTYKGYESSFNYFVSVSRITLFSPEGLTKKATYYHPKKRRFKLIPFYDWNNIITFECRG